MTLIAGLVCDGGIVLAADSEESGITRRSVKKMFHNVEGLRRLLGDKLSPVVIAGAGNGTLCDYAMQQIVPAIEFLQNLTEIEEKIEEVLHKIYTVQIPVHPVSDPRDANFELLIGIKTKASPAPVLYSTEGATVVKRETYYVSGSGALMEYMLDQIYTKNMSVEDATAAALYMLQVAKSYVNGVGGESRLMVLTKHGEVKEKPNWEISEEENLSKQYSVASRLLLLAAMRTRTGSEEEFKVALGFFIRQIKELREQKKQSDLKMDEWDRQVQQALAQMKSIKDSDQQASKGATP